MGEITPSENEWMIMEIVWASKEKITAAQIIEQLKGKLDVSDKTVRVMINRLVAKGILGFEVDPDDARIYHYFSLRQKDECLGMKSRRFIDSFFGGDTGLAIASFIKNGNITEEELDEIRKIIERIK